MPEDERYDQGNEPASDPYPETQPGPGAQAKAAEEAYNEVMNGITDAEHEAVDALRARFTERGLDGFLIVFDRKSRQPIGFLSPPANVVTMQEVLARLSAGNVLGVLRPLLGSFRDRASTCRRNALAMRTGPNLR